MKRSVVALMVLGSVLPWGAHHALARSGSRTTGLTARMLQIRYRAFAPGTIERSFVDRNSNNRDKNQWPRDEHSQNYGYFGRISGYYQFARWHPAGVARDVFFEYEGSFFRGPNGAVRTWRDGSTTDLQYQGVTRLSCPPGLPAQCTRLSVAFQGGTWEYYDTFQVGRCLSEARAKTGLRVLNQRKTAILTTLANIDAAAYATMRSVCGS